MEKTFGELEKNELFIRNKRWYRKYSKKYSGKTEQFSGFGSARDDKNRINFFGNFQKVKKYEFQ